MKATFIKNVETAAGIKKLYELDPPLEGNRFVTVSAVNAMFSGPETYIFPADEKGKITDWLELRGSYKGGLDHVAALENAGYSVA